VFLNLQTKTNRKRQDRKKKKEKERKESDKINRVNKLEQRRRDVFKLCTLVEYSLMKEMTVQSRKVFLCELSFI